MHELDRIRQEYQRRSQNQAYQSQYSIFNPAQLFALQQRERYLLKLLISHQCHNLAESISLDLGCGSGNLLNNLSSYGAAPHRLFGVDLMPDRLKNAKLLNEQFGVVQSDAGRLPFPKATFTLIFQSTVFTSILDEPLKIQVAQEMLRVLQLDGLIIWYDFWFNNPQNRHVKGIRPSEIKVLFPNCTFDFRRLTLAPPIARRIVPVSWLLAELLSKIPWLLTHYMVAIRKR